MTKNDRYKETLKITSDFSFRLFDLLTYFEVTNFTCSSINGSYTLVLFNIVLHKIRLACDRFSKAEMYLNCEICAYQFQDYTETFQN